MKYYFNLIKKITAITIMSLMVSAALCSASSEDFFKFTQRAPRPRLIEPVTEKVNLTGKAHLRFKWSTSESGVGYRKYYDFRLYKGYDMLESTLIFKQRIEPNKNLIDLPVDMFDDDEVYSWSLRQRTSAGKSPRSSCSFKVIKK
jgi:hypothetical protein